MTQNLRFLPNVEDDAIAGYQWYENKATGLGEEFLRLFYACASDISQNPLFYPIIYCDFRRRLLRRFPYAIYYLIEENTVVVFGLFHCARDPNSIIRELSHRNGEESP